MSFNYLRKTIGALRCKFFSLKYFGLNGMDKALEIYLPSYGTFVELGANDGKSQSNTLHLEKYHGWRGLLIEPEISNYEKCKINRKAIVVNAACVSFNYESETVPFIYSDLMTIASSGLETDINDPVSHATLGISVQKHVSNHEFNAPAQTLNSILVKHSLDCDIDLLSLEVEGAEIEVLKGLDHSHFRFGHCLIESRSEKKLAEFMQLNGYELITKLSDHDFLFRNVR
jgi:FkbM family methyltransferase